jgi:hypothetical protein
MKNVDDLRQTYVLRQRITLALSMTHPTADQAMVTAVIDMHPHVSRVHMNVMHVTLLVLVLVLVVVVLIVVSVLMR